MLFMNFAAQGLDKVIERFYFADIQTASPSKIKRQNTSEVRRPRMRENTMSCPLKHSV
jgi:hypothetical protein